MARRKSSYQATERRTRHRNAENVTISTFRSDLSCDILNINGVSIVIMLCLSAHTMNNELFSHIAPIIGTKQGLKFAEKVCNFVSLMRNAKHQHNLLIVVNGNHFPPLPQIAIAVLHSTGDHNNRIYIHIYIYTYVTGEKYQ